jgi:hypothetical protein
MSLMIGADRSPFTPFTNTVTQQSAWHIIPSIWQIGRMFGQISSNDRKFGSRFGTGMNHFARIPPGAEASRQ